MSNLLLVIHEFQSYLKKGVEAGFGNTSRVSLVRWLDASFVTGSYATEVAPPET